MKEYLSQDGEDSRVIIPLHPLGIKPKGNEYTATRNLKTAMGKFNLFPDELIVLVLESLDSRSLINVGSTCKALYAFTNFEDLWKMLFIEYVFDHREKLCASMSRIQRTRSIPNVNVDYVRVTDDFGCYHDSNCGDLILCAQI